MKAWKQDSRPCYTQQTHLDLVTHWHTHTPLSSLRTTWVLLNASDQHTLRPASSCHWSGPSSPAVTRFLTCSGERRVDRVSQLLKLCWKSCCCCRVEAHYLLWLMSPETLPGCQVGHAPPTLLHSRPVGETTQKVLHDSPWRRLRTSGRSQDLDFKHEETIDAVTSPISRSNTSNPIFLRLSYLYFYW